MQRLVFWILPWATVYRKWKLTFFLLENETAWHDFCLGAFGNWNLKACWLAASWWLIRWTDIEMRMRLSSLFYAETSLHAFALLWRRNQTSTIHSRVPDFEFIVQLFNQFITVLKSVHDLMIMGKVVKL